MSSAHRWLPLALAALSLGAPAHPVLGQGVYISSSGPLDRGMGGASSTAAMDALGTAYWNPAAIRWLSSSELAVGMELIASNHRVASSLGSFAGSSEASNGAFPIPSVAWVHRPARGPAFGVSLSSVAGVKTNLAADPANPVLMPAPTGLGRVSSEASFFQFAPMISLGLSRDVAIGFGPIVTLGQVAAEPFVFASPNVNGHYSSARATRYHWGGGGQLGLYYAVGSLRLAASAKSRTWMEDFHFMGEDAEGAPRVLRLDLDLPTILSVGAAYVRPETWTLALDLRYFDYEHASGFKGPANFDATGALGGLGWRSIVSAGVGVQRRLSGAISVRAGYAYNENPIPDEDSFFNLASPLIYQHTLSVGGSIGVGERSSINLAYSYFPPEQVDGPIVSPIAGPVAGSSVRNTLHVHVVSVGVSARY